MIKIMYKNRRAGKYSDAFQIGFLLIFFPLTFQFSHSPAQGKDGTSLGISANSHYFTDSEDKPLFWQGDTEWELFRYFTVSEAKALLTERRKQGFNVVQVIINGVFPEWGSLKGMKPWEGMTA